jgi:hypothetical protein
MTHTDLTARSACQSLLGGPSYCDPSCDEEYSGLLDKYVLFGIRGPLSRWGRFGRVRCI